LIHILNIVSVIIMSLFEIYGVILVLIPHCWRGQGETNKKRLPRILVSNIASCSLQTTLCVILTLVVWELAMRMLGRKYTVCCSLFSQASHLGLRKLCAEGFVERRLMQSS
jgi:formate hydrogenlyase subunit 3/multisubunit Na+/H+ antiporter MnhD subunit